MFCDMSLENNYSSSFEEDQVLAAIIESIAATSDASISKVIRNLNKAYNSSDYDIEYMRLSLEELNNDLLDLFVSKIAYLNYLSTEKLEDFKNEN